MVLVWYVVLVKETIVNDENHDLISHAFAVLWRYMSFVGLHNSHSIKTEKMHFKMFAAKVLCHANTLDQGPFIKHSFIDIGLLLVSM